MAIDETAIDLAAISRLAKALTFISGAQHPTTIALNAAVESQSERDIKKARLLFLQLSPSIRKAAFALLDD